MTSNGPMVGLAALVLIGACGAGIQSREHPSDQTEIVVPAVGASTTSIHVDQDLPPESKRPEVRASDLQGTSISTAGPASVTEEQTTTTTTSNTTTSTDDVIDLQSVFEALNALDSMLDDFESEVGAIDLEEEEGATP